MIKAVINLQQLKHKVKGTQMMKKLTNVHLQLNGFLQTKKAQAVNKRTNELSFRVKEGLNIRVSQNIKLVVDSAVGVLIDAEAVLMRLTGTGHHHHRHHPKRDARQSERNIVVTEKDQDSSSD